MFSDWKEDFEDVEISHKIDELLYAAKLFMNIDAISNSTSDSKVSPTP
jgi:hypothetical protein